MIVCLDILATITSIKDETIKIDYKIVEPKISKNKYFYNNNFELQKYRITKMSNYKNIEKENA